MEGFTNALIGKISKGDDKVLLIYGLSIGIEYCFKITKTIFCPY